jgi:hypothetical protein
MKLTSLLAAGILVTGQCVFTTNVKAVSYFEDFNNFSGATDYTTGADVTAGWRHYPNVNAGLDNTWSFPTLSLGNNGYKLTSNAGTAATNPGRVGSWYNAAGFTAISDFLVAADILDWTSTYGQYMGLTARSAVQSVNFPNAYGLVLRNDQSGPGTSTALQITKLDAFGQTTLTGNQGFFNVSGASDAPAPSGDYRLVFWGVGSSLYGQIIDLSTGLPMLFNDGSGGLTDIVSATDASYANGRTGLLGFIRTDQGVDPTFDNFYVTSVVPEPTTAALAGLGIASLLVFRRRR